eukprot:SAG22_NODE_444_length_10453_cov_8.586343_6_plen_144_part_00
MQQGAAAHLDAESRGKDYGTSTSLATPLPAGLHLLSFYIRQPKTADSAVMEIVVQLQDVVEHAAAVVLKGGIAALLGSSVAIAACTETTVTLQQPLAENRRLVWLAADGTDGGQTPAAAVDCATEAIAVRALDIRTFVVKLKA